ncbi:single-stranded DNA-binding protein [Treponema zuelzerae]|uniref:Single-stranded DNA-binding protein n=1 Tax=Teretinema zuelzerae TaxID=156 RepID=A0AAE3EJ88_9SPIR|nr:single-stranded DNA-binding protein [Teretinema zuelzerae]MCD1654424.1 single-stranded DNA-binding protein [Teretinema zuelzerae]MCD1654488.1 single-stranded DNA-binding protein [Teretinema zuelzerae]
MGDLNHVTLTGRVVRDAELKRKGANLVMCEFSLANNYSKKTGETWSKKANFFKLVVFGKMAEGLHPYLKKGALIGIEAELRQNQWEQEGKKYSSNELIINEVQLLSSPKKSNEAPSSSDYPAEEESFLMDIY